MFTSAFAKSCCTIALVVAVFVLAGCANLPFGGEPTPATVIMIATPSSTEGTVAESSPTSADPSPTSGIAIETATPKVQPSPTVQPGGVGSTSQSGQSLLRTVQERGRLICGTNADLPGFGFYDNVRDQWSGFDVDFCRVIAAAVLGDSDAVEFVGLTTSGPNERFAAIVDGKVDVLFRNTTWTLSRDARVDFGPTIFHDGQSFMVRKSSGITTLEDLEGQTICVSKGTTTELNLNDDFAARGISFIPVTFDDESKVYPAYDEQRCDAVTSDSSQLASKRETLEDPDAHIILGTLISREPLGPAFINDDSLWHDAVSWSVFATIYAEELRVDQSNVEELAETSDDPRIRRLLGLEGELGAGIGLPNDFGFQIISQVGNYADIYDRNLGPETYFALERGPNKVWNLGEGGVLESPPFR
jgi:general L-amino acid transport system substrate-binding protein